MKITKTAKLKILSHTKTFDDTIDIYNKALSFYIAVCEKERDNTQELKNSKQKLNYIESITHRTSHNENIKYDFDEKFYKFPSYLRRAAIMEALGILDSHFSRLQNWHGKRAEKLAKNKKFFINPPTLNYEPKSFPMLYRDNMWQKIKDGKARIKVFKNNDWQWIDIDYSTKNLKSGKNDRFLDFKEYNPMLVKCDKKYFLHIAYEKNIKLNTISFEDQRVIGVDLGLTNSAVCSCVNSSGTVMDRLFINQSREKDRLNHKLNKLIIANRTTGISEKPNYWRRINGLLKFIAQDSANKIVNFAIKNEANAIVFEHLGRMKIPKDFFGVRRLRAKLQYWAKMKVQRLAEEKAHSLGIRISRVLASGTSQYAYDGSGEVKRTHKKDIAIFQNGKTYHADLSASYNIASRYFIRAILKPLSEMIRLTVKAKVPSLLSRTCHTLSTLISLRQVAESIGDTFLNPYLRQRKLCL